MIYNTYIVCIRYDYYVLTYLCRSWPLIDKLFEINERTRKIDLIGLNIRGFIYFIEYLYLWFITIDFRRLSTIHIIFMLVH